MKIRKSVLIAIVAILLLVVGSYFAALQKDRKESPLASTYNSSSAGLMALYETLQDLGTPVDRLHYPITPDRLKDVSVLVMAANPRRLEYAADEDGESLLEWIEDGGTLILMRRSGEADPLRPPDSLEDLAGELDIKFESDSAEVRRMTFEETIDESLWHTEAWPAVSSPYTAGVRTVVQERTAGISLNQPSIFPLIANENGAMATMLPKEKGHVITVASSSLAENSFINRAENFRFMWNLLEGHRGDGKILFDEYHQGFSLDRDTWDLLQTPTLRATGLQMLILLCLYLLARGTRFGAILPYSDYRRRSHLEYVEAMGNLYARSRSDRHVLETLLSHFKEEVHRRRGISVTSSPAELEKLLGDQMPQHREQIETALATYREADARSRPTRRLVKRAARNLEQVLRLMDRGS